MHNFLKIEPWRVLQCLQDRFFGTHCIYLFVAKSCNLFVVCLPDHNSGTTHPWPFSKSKFNLGSDRVNLIVPASPIERLLDLPKVRAIQYKLGPERLTRLGNSNVLRLRVEPLDWFASNFNSGEARKCS